MTSTPPVIHPANRLQLDYRAEAAALGRPVIGITDVHTHINGTEAARLYAEVAQLYGIERTYSMTHLENVAGVRDILGDSLRLIAVPEFNAEDLLKAFTTEWLERIEKFAAVGCRICKFWCAPRAKDYGRELGEPNLLDLDSPWRRESMKLARDCGMMFMAHIADPDTWFATKYIDVSIYGTKREQYRPLERLLAEYADTPWLVAHLGGYPEDLEFLDGLLNRHGNLYLDTSATKWMVRELSKHSRADLRRFLTDWKGRILFGSDIVTLDAHLETAAEDRAGMGLRASSRDQAFDLYASRYFALRTLFETAREMESPIADPDLQMVNPDHYDADAAPPLVGQHLPEHVLRSIYHDAAADLLEGWQAGHE